MFGTRGGELDHTVGLIATGELGPSIAHETIQPLTAIVTNATALLQWLDTVPPNLAKARETAEWILRDGEWAADVVRGLRALSGNTPGRRELVDVNQSLEEILPIVQGEVQHRAISLVMRLAPGLPPVRGDRVQLQQVTFNLVRNSINAMAAVDDRPRELLISTYAPDEETVGVLVRDTGGGAHTDRLGYVSDRASSMKFDGMVIGLSISRRIIHNHGGEMWANINPDFGMTFEFSIPACLPPT